MPVQQFFDTLTKRRLGCGFRCSELGDYLSICRQAFKGDLPIAARLHHAGDGVVVLVGKRIELVVVTTGAPECHAQKRLAKGVDAVVHPIGFVLTDINWRMHLLSEEPKAGA